MKVVITSFTYFPNLDGVAEATRFLAESLVESGHHVVVFTSSISAQAKEFAHRGVNIRQYRLANCLIPETIGSLEEIERFRMDLHVEKPELLICACWDAWTTTLVQHLKEDISCPSIMVSHGFTSHLRPRNAPAPFFGWGQWWRGMIWTALCIPKLINSFDRFVFLASHKDTERFIDHAVMSLLDPDAVRIIPNSPNLDQLTDSRNDFRNRHGIGAGPMILCVANFSARKNQELAVSSFFEAGIPGSTLVCIGSEQNDYFNQLESLVKALQPSHPEQKVLLLNGISRCEIMMAYATSNITLLTATEETQPIVLIESMAFSKPWIATNSGCIADMEGGIPVCRQEEITHSLRHLMFHVDDAERLGAHGRKAYDAKYEPRVVKRKWMQLIAELSPEIS